MHFAGADRGQVQDPPLELAAGLPKVGLFGGRVGAEFFEKMRQNDEWCRKHSSNSTYSAIFAATTAIESSTAIRPLADLIVVLPVALHYEDKTWFRIRLSIFTRRRAPLSIAKDRRYFEKREPQDADEC